MKIAPAAFLLLIACSTPAPAPAPVTQPAAANASFGMTREAAIEVCKPPGERAYLSRLRCPGGTAPEFRRVGSRGMRNAPRTPEEEQEATEQFFGPVPPGGRDYHVLDVYELQCGDQLTEVFVDMYHCEQTPPEEAPAGFTIVP